MATTAVTSTTNTITALGAGSGVDVKALAQSLVDAEKAPRKSLIDARIKKSEGGVSGYAALKYVLNDLKKEGKYNFIIPKLGENTATSLPQEIVDSYKKNYKK